MPNRAFLKASLALWRRRLAYRERRHRFYHYSSKRPEEERKRLATKWHKLATEASAMVARREKQLAQASSKPRIVTAKQQGLSFVNRFGQLGPERYVTVHHTAGPTDGSDSRAVSLNQSYHRAHANKGWGGIGYSYCIARSGTIFCLRPTALKGAHVGGHNTSNVGVMFHGTTGDRPTRAQVDSFKWLLRNANTRAMPSVHRTDRPLNQPHTTRRGHNDWSGHTWNACPGTHKPILQLRRS